MKKLSEPIFEIVTPDTNTIIYCNKTILTQQEKMFD